MFRGRSVETARLDQLLAQARAGQSAALVVRGAAGIGKSTLLAQAERAARASGMRVLRGSGVETESELPFAGLHLLLAGELHRLDRLPQAQAVALRTALGLGTGAGHGEGQGAGGSGSDRFLVGLAVLTLLADLADECPLLCLVDDAHWFDQESAATLLFVARRLGADRIAVLLAARDEDAPAFVTPGLAELRLGGLEPAEAEALLTELAPALSRNARELILREAAGNPLALGELPALQREDERYASPYGTVAVPMHSRLLDTFARTAAALPEPSQTLLLVAAADDTGELAVQLAAAARLGAGLADLAAAEQARLIQLDQGRLVFRHPVIRTAVYQSATSARKLTVHQAIAAALDGHPERADQRAWHLAAAATGPDEATARLLELSAERARARGGFAAVTAAYQRAARLSPGAAERGRRLVEAAQAACDAGRLDLAEELAAQAQGLGEPLVAARAVRIRATVADEQDRSRDAHAMLFDSALALAEQAPERAGALLFQAAQAAWHAGDHGGLDKSAARAKALDLPGAERIAALATLAAAQYRLDGAEAAEAARAARQLLAEQADAGCASGAEAGSAGSPSALRAEIQLGWWHLFGGELTAAHDLTAELERRCREHGAIGLVALAQLPLARTQVMLGRHRDAYATATDGLRIAQDTGQARLRVYLSTVLAQLAALRGDESECHELVAEALARGIAPSTVHAAGALSLLDLGLGRPAAALDRLAACAAAEDRQGVLASLPDLVEAAVRSDQPERGLQAAAWYQQAAAQSRQPWQEAIALRCRALLAGDPALAQAHYEQAVGLHLGSAGSPFELARTRLVYGEWLRRARRTGEARAQLRPAEQTFEGLGAVPWAERARAELRATGESVAPRTAGADLLDQLTPQELQVARLAAQGLSNREIGAQLFVSPRTAGYHLSHVYPKLGITSRTELARLGL